MREPAFSDEWERLSQGAVTAKTLASSARHLRAALTLERVAEQHDEAARLWLYHDDAELAGIETRSATLTRQMAALERDCAELSERRAAGGNGVERGAAAGRPL